MSCRNKKTYASHSSLRVGCGLLAFLVVLPGLAANSPSPSGADAVPNAPPLIITGRQSSRPADSYTEGIGEIIKMLQANLEESVILAFIRNSPVPYDPDAADLLALQDHGASAGLLAGLLHRGDELRVRYSQGASSPELAAAGVAYIPPSDGSAPVPPETADPEAAQPTPSADTPTPPDFYTYGYGWPRSYGAPAGDGRGRHWRHRAWWAERRLQAEQIDDGSTGGVRAAGPPAATRPAPASVASPVPRAPAVHPQPHRPIGHVEGHSATGNSH